MMSKFLASFALASGLFGVWYGYAPADQRDALPPRVKSTAAKVDAALSRALPRLASFRPGNVRGTLCAALGTDGVVHQVVGDAATSAGDLFSCVPLRPDPTAPDIRLTQGIDRPAPAPLAIQTAEGRVDGPTLKGEDLTGAAFAAASLAGADGINAALDGAIFRETDLSGARLDGARLEAAIISGSLLSRARFYDATARHLLVDGGIASGADFRGARLSGARFVGVDLTGTRWDRADLRHAMFVGATVTGATFHGADLSGADLSRTRGLDADSLARACGDQDTRLPAGIPITLCGARDESA